MKNRINWSRDELILALDVYRRIDPKRVSVKSREIIDLSKLLNSLPIHPLAQRGNKFRNENGVNLKLGNFMWLDERYPGEGLRQGGKLDKVIWDEFAGDENRLKGVALAILKVAGAIPPPGDIEEIEIDESEEFVEGRLLTQMHRRRERNLKASQKRRNWC